jgi:hypothetical protein
MNESAIKNAVQRIKAGEDPEKVLWFVYHLGETEGMLKMASVAEEELLKMAEAA